MPKPEFHFIKPPCAALRAVLPLLLLLSSAGCGGDDDDDGNGPPQLTPATPAALSGSCPELAGKLAGLANTRITASTAVAAGTLKVAGQDVAQHCHVTGVMHERVSAVDGKPYAIGFEMRLPIAWNGRQGRETVHDAEPEVGFWRHLSSRILGLLIPHDWR